MAAPLGSATPATDNPSATPFICAGDKAEGLTKATKYAAIRVPEGAQVTITRKGSADSINYYNGFTVDFDVFTSWILAGQEVHSTGTGVFRGPEPTPFHEEFNHITYGERFTNNTGAAQTYGLKYTSVFSADGGTNLAWEESYDVSGGAVGACAQAFDGSDLFGPNPSMGNQCCHSSTQHSVDTLSGNEHFELPGDHIAARGPGLDFELAHNSGDAPYDGLFGHGWRSTFDMALGGPDASGIRHVFQETGATVPFSQVSPGAWKAPANFDASLVPNADGTWTFTRKRDEFFTFGSNGRLLKIADRNGYATNLNYTDERLTSVQDDAGHQFTFEYSRNRVSRITDPLAVDSGATTSQRSIKADYDNDGNLATYTDIGGGQWNLGYDASHRLVSARSPKFEASPNKDWEWHYDQRGRVDWEEDPLDRRTEIHYNDPEDGATRVVEPDGDSRVDYYTNGHRTAVTVGYNDPEKRSTTTYELDPVTDMVTATVDGRGKRWLTDYTDPVNPLLVTKSTDPLGRTRRMTYDSYGQLLALTNGAGEITRNTYDSRGNLRFAEAGVGTASATAAEYVYGDPAHPGDVTSIIDGRGKTWVTTYDVTTGDKLSAADPLGDKTTWAYNTIGWITTSVAPEGNKSGATQADQDKFTTTYRYDRYGAPSYLRNPNGEITTSEYDPDGHLTRVVDPGGEIAMNTYTDAGELESTTAAFGTPSAQTTTYQYSPDGNLKTWTRDGTSTWVKAFDALGRVQSQTDPLGRVTRYDYDKTSHLIAETQPGGTCDGTTSSHCITMNYDDAGQLRAMDYTDPATPDIALTYDDAGRRRTQVVEGSGASAGTSTWTWTPRGQVDTTTDAAGLHTRYAYDAAGNLTQLTYPGQTQPVVYGYDDAGRMATVDDWAGNHSTFAYDLNSNLIERAITPTTTPLDQEWSIAGRTTLQIGSTRSPGAARAAQPWTQSTTDATPKA